MRNRFFGGMAVFVGVAGLAVAQTTPPATLPQTTPAKPVPKPASATATPAPAAPTTAAPAPAPAISTPCSQLLTSGGVPGTAACPSYSQCCNPCPCGPCGPAGKYWIDAGYILWHTSGQHIPALVTTGTGPRATAGTLGDPATRTLYGNDKYNDGWRSGFYLNAGVWCDPCQKHGLEGNFFFLGDNNSRFNSTPNGIITRPFFNTNTGGQDTQLVNFPDSQLVNFPGILTGTVSVESKSSIIGGGVNYVHNLCCSPCSRVDFLLGYSYFNLADEININENLTSLPGQQNVVPGTTFLVHDQFKTSNNFHGGNLGLAGERRWSHYYVSARGGVALGVNHSITEINGSTVITPPGGPSTTYVGGLLAQPSNIGKYTRDEFSVMPWFNIRLGCQVTERARVYVGYDFLYMDNVLRAGDQIDLRVNPTQIPPRTNGTTGTLFPIYTPKTSGFTAQGIRIGAELRF